MFRPSFANSFAPLKTKGAGKDRVRAAPAVSCALMHKRMLHMSIQVQRKHSGLPCAMALRLIRALPGDPAFLSPSPAGLTAGLTPTLGASGPHAFAVRIDVERLATQRVHRDLPQR